MYEAQLWGNLTTDCTVLLSQIQRNPKQCASLTLWSWWQRPVWAQLAHRSFPLCEPYGPFVSHACTSACTPCGTSQPSCRSVSWSPCGPECKRENTSKQFKALSDISIHTGILLSAQSFTLPFSQPAASWHAWPSWPRRPFAFSKGSQGPPEPFFCLNVKKRCCKEKIRSEVVDKIPEHMYIAQLQRAMTESWGLLACQSVTCRLPHR